jgi:HTH-type transcriptional regulator / antitoxin HipB
MNYPVTNPAQLKAVLRSLRKSRGLTQEQLGAKLGISQKRMAGIEKAPHVTGFDRIAEIVSLLGGRLVIEDLNERGPAPTAKW